MSGHSKWSQIKHKKALTDSKRGKLFSKLSLQISLAAREKGGDQGTNPSLRMTIEKARSFNFPLENIERAIKRGTGELEDIIFEEFILEAYGPGSSALIIEGTTDNKNRTFSELKHLLTQYNGKSANPGSVLWLFERRGVLVINKNPPSRLSNEELELLAIDNGATDLRWIDAANLEIYCLPEQLDKVKKALEGKTVAIAETSLEWAAKNEIPLDDLKMRGALEKLLEILDDHDDVSEVFSNVNF
jgi:YebC/PmpR family DNA-binding regulatory protein